MKWKLKSSKYVCFLFETVQQHFVITVFQSGIEKIPEGGQSRQVLVMIIQNAPHCLEHFFKKPFFYLCIIS